jgi:hypothetical protein
LNAEGVISGSAQVSFTSIVDKPTLVSGSSQITFGSISSIPSGLVSGSSQITLSSTTGYGTVINQAVLTTSTPTFGGLTIGNGLATGRSSWGAPTNTNIILTSSTTDGTGNCGIEFRSGNNFPSDGASIYFENNASGGASERAKLTIRVENDAEDFMELRAGNITLNSNTISAGGQNPSIIFQNSGVTISSISSTGVYNGSISGNAATATTATTAGALTSMNISQFTNNSGYLTSVTNISGTAGGETLATVTGRGASTSTAITINNNLTVTGGRVLAQSGGANTYGLFSGYDNNNHMMTFRAAIAGSTSSPTITAGHQTTFIEYAEANDTTGWFFKSASTGTYQEIARITRTGINWNGNTVYHTGNIPTWNQNTTGTASNITAHTINQSVGTGNNVQFNYLKLNNNTSSGGGDNGTASLKIGGSSDYDSFELGIFGAYDAMIRSYGNDIRYYSGHWRTIGNVSSEDHSHYWFTSKNGSANWSTAKLRLDHDGHLTPGFNGTQNLGSASLRWNTVFTSDLSLNNGIGDYTIVEGENDLFLYNNKQNKVYKFMLQEVNPNDATPKRPE